MLFWDWSGIWSCQTENSALDDGYKSSSFCVQGWFYFNRFFTPFLEVHTITESYLLLLYTMCEYNRVKFQCNHLRYTVREWCESFEKSYGKCKSVNIVNV